VAKPDQDFRQTRAIMGAGNGDIPVPFLSESATTDSERQVLETLLRHLRLARQDRLTGRITVEVNMREGGIVDKWVEVRTREK
jgi:hypothetical protein